MELVIFTGNIGCGKSLLASKYAKKGYIIINSDSITNMVQGGEYGAYDISKKPVYKAIEFAGIEEALKNNFSVVVDRTNITREDRATYIEIGKKYGATIVSRNFGPGALLELDRRLRDNRGTSDEVWKKVFEKMFLSYEEPAFDEGFGAIMTVPNYYRTYAFDFDGVIVENQFPAIGNIIQSTIEKINDIWSDEGSIIIIWTCRSGNHLRQMNKFLIENKIPFDFINENPLFETGSRKVFAHSYYDDRNAR